jgi:hypothetical protein
MCGRYAGSPPALAPGQYDPGVPAEYEDLVKLDAHTKVLSALRETQLEHGERLSSLEAEMRQGFAKLGAGMSYITTLLEHLDQRD